MRKVIFEIAVSVDGFIEGSKGELDWLTPINEEEAICANTFLSEFDTIFYGRDAYEKFGVPRPLDDIQAEAEREFHLTINNMRKFVFSRKAKHVAGNGMVIGENLEAEVRRISGEDGKNIWFCGGADILKTFIDLDLIDEYMLAVQPVILSSGKSLFRSLPRRLNLKLIKAQNLKSGVVVLYYQPGNRIHKENHDG